MESIIDYIELNLIMLWIKDNLKNDSSVVGW